MERKLDIKMDETNFATKECLDALLKEVSNEYEKNKHTVFGIYLEDVLVELMTMSFMNKPIKKTNKKEEN